MVPTYRGRCLELNPRYIIKQKQSLMNAVLDEHTTGRISGINNEATVIKFSVKYNKSDNTFGWSGARGSFTGSYSKKRIFF